MWECVGGPVTKDEDSITGALRETQKEAGLALSPEEGKLVHTVGYFFIAEDYKYGHKRVLECCSAAGRKRYP